MNACFAHTVVCHQRLLSAPTHTAPFRASVPVDTQATAPYVPISTSARLVRTSVRRLALNFAATTPGVTLAFAKLDTAQLFVRTSTNAHGAPTTARPPTLRASTRQAHLGVHATLVTLESVPLATTLTNASLVRMAATRATRL